VEQRAALGHVPEIKIAARRDGRLEVVLRQGRLQPASHQLRKAACGQRVVEIRLGGEIGVDQRLADAAAQGQRFHRQGQEPLI
jgi:hypothetical protein